MTDDIIDAAPVDDDGLLMHAEDPAAQLCLALVRLDDALHTRGLDLADIARLRVESTDVLMVSGVLDLVGERFAGRAPVPPLDLVEVEGLHPAGMLVALAADVAPRCSARSPHPSLHDKERHMITLTTELEALRAAGTVYLPGDPGYDDACTPWNLAVRLEPAAAAVPHSITEVVAVVRAAVAAGLRIAPQSTGHGAAALGGRPLDDALLLRLSGLTGVAIDPAGRTARVLGGTLWRDVVSAAAVHGLAAPHGSAGDVAVAGYVLGGGLSFYGRQHGLASAHVRAVELVTADGALVRATREEHGDLFWAIRGGGGNFGVVVAIELDLLPISDVFAGMLLWDLSQAKDVARTWIEWTRDLPRSATTSLRFMRFPPVPELPPFLSGRELVVMDGAILDSDEAASELLAPLRHLQPEMDTFARIPAERLLDVHMDPPGPVPAVGDQTLLTALPEPALDALLGVAGPGVRSPLMFVELRHLGGALAEPQDAAVASIDAAYALIAVAPAPTPEVAAIGSAAAAGVAAVLRDWSAPSVFLNFTERPVDARTAFTPEAWERLTSIRRSVDPARVWVAAHAVGADLTTESGRMGG